MNTLLNEIIDNIENARKDRDYYKSMVQQALDFGDMDLFRWYTSLFSSCKAKLDVLEEIKSLIIKNTQNV